MEITHALLSVAVQVLLLYGSQRALAQTVTNPPGLVSFRYGVNTP